MTSDETFLARFESAAIPECEWDHRAHVRVAYLLLCRHPFGEAVRRMREGIPRLNDAQGVPNTETSGYHETLTVAWVGLLAERIGEEPSEFDAFVLEHPELLRRDLVLDHYSRELLLSPRARVELVPPDRRPLAGCGWAA